MKHQETHPSLDIDGCFGCRVANIQVGANSTTTRGAAVEATNSREKRWNKDMPAYKRLRKQGLQPKKIEGASLLEKHATERWQIEGVPQ